MPEKTSIKHQPDSQRSSGKAPGKTWQTSFFRPIIQTKLTVNSPNDSYEQEADAVAEKVMRMPATTEARPLFFQPKLSPITPVQRKCSACEQEDKLQLKEAEEKEEAVQLKPGKEFDIQRKFNYGEAGKKVELTSEKTPGGGMPAPPVVQDAINSGGQPLDPDTRDFMESRFNYDFGKVQIHNDSLAHQSSAEINAAAYTHGHHVVFGKGRYQPGTNSGSQLLAHELAHNIQQSHTSGVIQRSMKFEFQTHNIVWRVKDFVVKEGETEKEKKRYAAAVKEFDPKPVPLGRKYGPKGDDSEDGSEVTFLSVGKHGEAATNAGDIRYVEAEGPMAMIPVEKDEKGYDEKKQAQFIKIYRFKSLVDRSHLLNNPVAVGQLELVEEKANTGNYNPNTFMFNYLNTDNKDLELHLNQFGVFEDGNRPVKVGRLEKPGMNESWPAQHIEIWKVTKAEDGTISMKDDMVKLEMISATDNAQVEGMEGKFNKGTYQRIYYNASEFNGNVLKENAKDLKVHLDDGRLKSGRADFLEQKKVVSKTRQLVLKENEEWEKEQTAIELQSEHRGVLEFETPKWFRDWNELKDRVQDAVDMTKAINSQPELKDSDTTPDGKILKKMRAKIPALIKADTRENYPTLHRVVEWPKDFSTVHLKKLHDNGEKFLVEIVDEKWKAKIQTSEGITLSQYSTLQRQHEGTAVEKIHHDNMKSIFTASGYKDIAKDDNRFTSLKGFLQLLVTYIFRGQVVDLTGQPAKFGFSLMARTDFASMYRSLLNRDEKKLFKEMVKDLEQKILTAELEAAINKSRKKKFDGLKARLDELALIDSRNAKQNKEMGALPAKMKRMENAIELKGDNQFFFAGHAAGNNPKIKDWLNSIWKMGETKIPSRKTKAKMEAEEQKYKDSLSSGSQSAAMGFRTVNTEPGDKDYELAQFEVRGSVAPWEKIVAGEEEPQQMKGNAGIQADDWLVYIKQIFESAQKRSSDTPDDPTTPVNEAAKTGLKIPAVKEEDKQEEEDGKELSQSQEEKNENEIEIIINPAGGSIAVGYGRNFKLTKNLTLWAEGHVLVDLGENKSAGVTAGARVEYDVPVLKQLDLRGDAGMRIIGKLVPTDEKSIDLVFFTGASIQLTKSLRVGGEVAVPVSGEDPTVSGRLMLTF